MALGPSLIQTLDKRKLLQGCPICSALDESALTIMTKMTRELKVAKGKHLMEEGETCAGFFLILSGRVRVYKAAPSGKEKTLLIAEPGMTFGEDGLFGPGVFLESAEALESTSVLHIPRAEFLEVIRQDSHLAFQVMESLCLWIRRLSTSVENVVFHTAGVKLARFLLDLLREQKSSKNIILPAKKKEIAERLGMTPETLSRTLQELERRKIIKSDRAKIVVLNLDELMELGRL